MRLLFSLFPVLVFVLVVPAEAQMTLTNPVASGSVADFISSALKALVIVALPLLSLAIMYAGFMFVAARGKPDALATARRNFIYVMIGTLLILGAWMLANLLAGTVSQLLP